MIYAPLLLTKPYKFEIEKKLFPTNHKNINLNHDIVNINTKNRLNHEANVKIKGDGENIVSNEYQTRVENTLFHLFLSSDQILIIMQKYSYFIILLQPIAWLSFFLSSSRSRFSTNKFFGVFVSFKNVAFFYISCLKCLSGAQVNC